MTHEIERPARPWRLTGLMIALAMFQVGTMVRLASLPDALAGQISLIAPLEIAAGGLWALIFVVAAVNLLRSRTTRPSYWALIGFATYSTTRLFLFAQADYDRSRLPFLVAANLLVFIMAFFLRR